MRGLATLSSLALLAGVLSTTVPARASSSANDEDPVKYRFSKPLIDGLGVSSMADLRGKPTLIDYWGTR